MRTTLDIEDDVLEAVRELARQEGSTAGRILSTLARRGLQVPPVRGILTKQKTRGGVPVLPSRGEIVTIQRVRRLMDQEGI